MKKWCCDNAEHLTRTWSNLVLFGDYWRRTDVNLGSWKDKSLTYLLLCYSFLTDASQWYRFSSRIHKRDYRLRVLLRFCCLCSEEREREFGIILGESGRVINIDRHSQTSNDISREDTVKILWSCLSTRSSDYWCWCCLWICFALLIDRLLHHLHGFYCQFVLMIEFLLPFSLNPSREFSWFIECITLHWRPFTSSIRITLFSLSSDFSVPFISLNDKGLREITSLSIYSGCRTAFTAVRDYSIQVTLEYRFVSLPDVCTQLLSSFFSSFFSWWCLSTLIPFDLIASLIHW